MLALVERGEGEELVGVLRSLAEVSANAGRCRDALDFAGRAIRVAQEAGLSPGPVWYTGAVAELAGGTLARAAAYAERGCRASEQEHDSIHLGRNLHALGQVLLRSGDAPGRRRRAAPDPGPGAGDRVGRAIGAALARRPRLGPGRDR
jgi:hypothetical protein